LTGAHQSVFLKIMFANRSSTPGAAVLIVAAALAGGVAPASAQHARPADTERGTVAQRLACTPDVFRLCSHLIPNVPPIIACLRSNRRNLNPDCRAVFEGRLR
jgi:hypothetical protein